MIPFILFTVLLRQSLGAFEDGSDMKDILKMLQRLETNMLIIKEDLEDRMAKLEVEDPDVEERLAKLEDLAKIGTLRSCYEYSQYGLKTSGPYMIDPDGGLIGQEPFQVLDRQMNKSYSQNSVFPPSLHSLVRLSACPHFLHTLYIHTSYLSPAPQAVPV